MKKTQNSLLAGKKKGQYYTAGVIFHYLGVGGCLGSRWCPLANEGSSMLFHVAFNWCMCCSEQAFT